MKKPKYQGTFKQFGNSLDLNEDFLQEIEAFTCDLYGHPRKKRIDEVRVLSQWGVSRTFGEIFTFQKAVKNDRKSNSTIF